MFLCVDREKVLSVDRIDGVGEDVYVVGRFIGFVDCDEHGQEWVNGRPVTRQMCITWAEYDECEPFALVAYYPID